MTGRGGLAASVSVAAMSDAPRPNRLLVALPFVGLALSGFAGLIYEVVWTRAVATLFGSVV